MSKEQTENPGLFAQFVFKTRVFLKCQTSHHEKKITPTERCCWKMVCFRPSFYRNFSGVSTLEYERQEAKVMKVWFRCFSFSIGFCFLLGDFFTLYQGKSPSMFYTFSKHLMCANPSDFEVPAVTFSVAYCRVSCWVRDRN